MKRDLSSIAPRGWFSKSTPAPSIEFRPAEPRVGAWDVGGILFSITRRPTDEQIRNTEELLGWKWVEVKR